MLALVGCSRSDSASSSSPGSVWGEPVSVAMLEPFQGTWQFDQERTLAHMQAAGVPEEQVARIRDSYRALAAEETDPDSQRKLRSLGIDPKEFREWAGQMHQNLTFDGHVATGDGLVSCEYRLFAVHEHDRYVCAKAWHHEDRFDPGDMSKCYVRLAVVGEELHLQVKMQEGWPADDDPDLRGTPPVVAGPRFRCDADAPTGKHWTEWAAYVFVRPSASP
jgi:hypothetical protein